MALTTTVGGATSDSYGTLDAFYAYCEAMGWVYSTFGYDETIEVALRRSTMWLDRESNFIGVKVAKAQALEWPCYTGGVTDKNGFVIESDEVPQPIIDAEFEMAWMILNGETPLATIENGAIKTESVSAGSVARSVTYGGISSKKEFTAVAGLLQGLATGGSNQSDLIRG